MEECAASLQRGLYMHKHDPNGVMQFLAVTSKKPSNSRSSLFETYTSLNKFEHVFVIFKNKILKSGYKKPNKSLFFFFRYFFFNTDFHKFITFSVQVNWCRWQHSWLPFSRLPWYNHHGWLALKNNFLPTISRKYTVCSKMLGQEAHPWKVCTLFCSKGTAITE